MHPINRDLVDPSVTDEEIEKALDGTPAPFPDVEEQDDLDEAEPRGLVGIIAASKAQRIANARALRDNHTFVGVGMCLRTVHGPILNLPALFPTAAAAGDHSSPFHAITDPGSTDVPRAAIGFAWNGRAGHVWLELGGALVSTTDFHENGFEGVALRSRMLTWCGATRWGWGESVNGFDVWPDPKTKPQPPAPWTLEQRIHVLRQEQHQAHAAGHDRRAERYKQWADREQQKLEARK